ncbi:MAG: hypothetical protein K5787_12295 [Lentisphaeria bacterium]|nr:hypothetical protein [Lentisphaeria bacterium]
MRSQICLVYTLAPQASVQASDYNQNRDGHHDGKSAHAHRRMTLAENIVTAVHRRTTFDVSLLWDVLYLR